VPTLSIDDRVGEIDNPNIGSLWLDQLVSPFLAEKRLAKPGGFAPIDFYEQ
jgi:hypothetical protein